MKLCFDFQFFVPAKSVKNLLHINLYSKIMRKASKHPFGFFFGWFQFSQISIISYTKSENWVHVRLHPWKFHKQLYAAQSFQFVQEYKWPRSLRLTLVDITQKKLETNQCNGTRWDESVWMGDSFPCSISIFPSHILMQTVSLSTLPYFIHFVILFMTHYTFCSTLELIKKLIWKAENCERNVTRFQVVTYGRNFPLQIVRVTQALV